MFNITNYNDHPTRKTYTVFHFHHKERADYFEELLKQSNIWFESDLHQDSNRTTYYYGIKNSDLKKVEKINYLVSAKYRKSLISNKFVSVFLYIFSLVIIILIIIGYLNSKT